MTDHETRGTPVTQSAWFGFLPALGALAALNAYGLMIAFPSISRPQVPLAAPFAAGAFALLQILFPTCRLSRERLISPLNWALLAFFLQLVVMPLTISWAEPALGMLPYLPGLRALDQSIVLSVVAFGAFSVGCALAAHRTHTSSRSCATRMPGWIVVLYAGIGVAGLLLRFGSVAEVFQTLAEPARFSLSAEQEGTLRGAAGTFLRPFLLSSFVMAWCLWIDRRGVGSSRLVRYALTLATAIAVVIVGATYGFNRAAFMVPLLAMAAAYSEHVRRLSLTTLAITGVVLGGLAVVPGQYRSSNLTAAELARSSSARQRVFQGDDLGTEVQVYGSAPQFSGYLLEAAEQSSERFTPRVLLGSLLSPVPILGKAFRDTSGPAAYNRLIYGNTGVADQIIPFEAEVYLCLGPAGLLGAFLIIGLIIGRLQRGFDRAATAFDSYALQFTTIWVAFLVQGSLASVSQIFIFFFWPIYGYVFLRLCLGLQGARGCRIAGDAPCEAQ